MSKSDKASDYFVSIIALTLAIPVMLIIHIGKSFWAGFKFFLAEQSLWWSDVWKDFK